MSKPTLTDSQQPKPELGEGDAVREAFQRRSNADPDSRIRQPMTPREYLAFVDEANKLFPTPPRKKIPTFRNMLL